MENRIDIYTAKIPCYAICAIINGEVNCLEDEDRENVEKYVESWYKSFPDCDIIFSCPDGEPYFEPFPAFGLASDVYDVEVGVIPRTH